MLLFLTTNQIHWFCFHLFTKFCIFVIIWIFEECTVYHFFLDCFYHLFLFKLFLIYYILLLIYLYFNYSSIKHLILLFFILFWNHPNPMSYFHIRIYLKYIFFIINQIWFYSFPLYDLRKLVFHKNNFSLIIFLFLKIVYISYLLSKY